MTAEMAIIAKMVFFILLKFKIHTHNAATLNLLLNPKKNAPRIYHNCVKLHDIKHVEFDRIKNFRHASRAGGGKCGVESAIMDANCRFINIVLNDNIVEQMF